jgi:proteasome accessory factor A
MRERLLGLETEYAISATDRSGRRASRTVALDALLRRARKRLVCLPGGHSAGLFLASGGRLYGDAGSHPELATPECTHPAELLLYGLAGDRVLARLASEVCTRSRRLAEIVLARVNVDYLTGATFGSHENYAHTARPQAVSRRIVPHLVTRIVFTGAGGLDARCDGIDFLLSPRVPFLEHESSTSSTTGRGIHHAKDEPLGSSGLHRLHVICGESTCSRLAGFLRFGTTALVLALIEAGIEPEGGLRLTSPVAAMHAIARDPSCTATVALHGGGSDSAIGIQRRYLELAERHRRAEFMPPWTGDVCDRWRETLDLLERGPDAVASRLDWAIKRVLFRRHVARRGFDQDRLLRWTPILERLGGAIASSSHPGPTITVEEILSPGGPVAAAVRTLERDLRDAHLGWDELRPLVDLRKELCEIDVRYARVGRDGLYETLARSGALDDGVDGIGDVEAAMATPPARGRARLRGEAIRALAGRANCCADWHFVRDDAGRVLDLGDPLAEHVEWCCAGRTADLDPMHAPGFDLGLTVS